jgi:hypothetical protein
MLAMLAEAASNRDQPGHHSAARIVSRSHFRLLYESTPGDLQRNLNAPQLISEAAGKEFGAEFIRYNPYSSDADSEDFPVYQRDGSIASSVQLSTTFVQPPRFAVADVFVAPEVKEKAKTWLEESKDRILSSAEGV